MVVTAGEMLCETVWSRDEVFIRLDVNTILGTTYVMGSLLWNRTVNLRSPTSCV